ncbi:alginate O-acetyltransferase AlgF [uncultured Abyssibacter sp.]|uniref:alginate O-acetyltransferase AlgF n=1 Tax=uncultured Abyssibacter sp. TaxID=2320202 RepID=UPI0032B18890
MNVKTLHALRIGPMSWLTGLAAMILASAPLHAGDDALYGPEAPPGSAFVRIFNATPSSVAGGTIGGEPVETLDQYEASSYAFVPAGDHTISFGPDSLTRTLEADRYYTATLGDGGLTLHALDTPEDDLKALVVFYNLTDSGSLQLKTADGSATIAEAADGDFATREVNPLRVAMAVYAGDQMLADTDPVNLARGRAFSLFVTPGRGQPRLTWVVD